MLAALTGPLGRLDTHPRLPQVIDLQDSDDEIEEVTGTGTVGAVLGAAAASAAEEDSDDNVQLVLNVPGAATGKRRAPVAADAAAAAALDVEFLMVRKPEAGAQAAHDCDDVVVLRTRPAPPVQPHRHHRHRWVTAIKHPPGGGFELHALAAGHPERGDVERLLSERSAATAGAMASAMALGLYAWPAYLLQQQQHAPRRLTVRSVFKVHPPAHVLMRFEAYAATKPGTVKRCFHGTSSRCDVPGMERAAGVDPCGQPHCPACNICRTGLSVARAGQRLGGAYALNYGRGTYFSENPTKAQQFGTRPPPGGGPQATTTVLVFVCDVVAGATCTAIVAGAGRALSAPPPGYDSVGCALLHRPHYGAGFGGQGFNLAALNAPAAAAAGQSVQLFEELVVYRDDASVPRFLLLCTY